LFNILHTWFMCTSHFTSSVRYKLKNVVSFLYFMSISWNTISGFKLLLFCQAWNDIAIVYVMWGTSELFDLLQVSISDILWCLSDVRHKRVVQLAAGEYIRHFVAFMWGTSEWFDLLQVRPLFPKLFCFQAPLGFEK
jgi:DNA-binding LytR/AlgR family response regulator